MNSQNTLKLCVVSVVPFVVLKLTRKKDFNKILKYILTSIFWNNNIYVCLKLINIFTVFTVSDLMPPPLLRILLQSFFVVNFTTTRGIKETTKGIYSTEEYCTPFFFYSLFKFAAFHFQSDLDYTCTSFYVMTILCKNQNSLATIFFILYSLIDLDK